MNEKNENNRYKELSEFLKSRRARVLPSQVGLPETTHRRTPGLRREEVAQLAGVGLTWYTWLEQGRPIHVSVSILDSLSRVLLLNQVERTHLFQLANQPEPSQEYKHPIECTPALQHVIDSFSGCPALIIDSYWNVIAWNKEACILFGDFTKMDEKERNIVWSMFTEQKNKELYPDWEKYARQLLGSFRASYSQYIESNSLIQFVEELKYKSKEFEQWWTIHDLNSCCEKNKHLEHPTVGSLFFEVNTFTVADQNGLKLIVHVPDPETDTRSKMIQLMNEV
jgi:transcriptional regulator with XRE-family HTH domain